MEIKRAGSQPSTKGSAQYFTGVVRVDPLVDAPEPARVVGVSVTFEPGARTAWHTHPLGQTLIVTAGCGRVQREGRPVEEIRPGDVVWIAPGEKHWHGAAPTTAMTHIAIQEKLDGRAVDWLGAGQRRAIPRLSAARDLREHMRQDDDPFDLQRFVDAQNPVFDDALVELRAGRKRSHWMWFLFPQIAGLGFSPMAQRYAIRSRAEAEAYLAHPVLGDRLRECVRLVVAVRRPIAEIFGYPDDMKFRSCVTLFAAAAPGEAVFSEALDACCDGRADPSTLEKLASPDR
jgi:uncharacterized protein (DUF1810 family)/quercetin dioxygenase-like cupin family protein